MKKTPVDFEAKIISAKGGPRANSVQIHVGEQVKTWHGKTLPDSSTWRVVHYGANKTTVVNEFGQELVGKKLEPLLANKPESGKKTSASKPESANDAALQHLIENVTALNDSVAGLSKMVLSIRRSQEKIGEFFERQASGLERETPKFQGDELPPIPESTVDQSNVIDAHGGH